MGADKLLGNGDMLFLWPGTSTLLRGQGTYVSDDEINSVISFVGTTEPQFVKELVQLKPPSADGEKSGKLPNRDELYEAAVDLIVREGRGSVSLLQRGLGIGYGRAARLVDYMAEDGIVGQYNGSQAREVLLTVEQWEEMSGGGGDSAAKAAPAPTKPAPAPKPASRPSQRVVRPLPDDEREEEKEDELPKDDEADEQVGEADVFEEAEEGAPFDAADQFEEDDEDEDDEDDEDEDDADDESDDDEAEDVVEDEVEDKPRGPGGKLPPAHYRAESA
jgi:S-DNA-T family DNA segregation ATPase FtsK/SpoIIIE